MRKLKTILLSLIIFVACSFATACSCSGDDGEKNEILASKIAIECVTEGITSKVDENGLLSIECNKGDVFYIQYTITPDTVTSASVIWNWDKDGIIKSSVNDMSASAVEKVLFRAENRGETNLTFETENGKTAKAKVIVHNAVAALPYFATPSGIDYDIETGSITWTPVSKVEYRLNGELDRTESVTLDSSFETGIQGLKHYEVNVTNLTTGASTTQTTVTNYLSGVVESGNKYKVTVKAMGNNQQVKDSNTSSEFYFYQLNPVKNITKVGDKIKFTAPANTAEIKITNYAEATPATETISIYKSTGESEEEINVKNLPNYNVNGVEEFVIGLQAKFSSDPNYAVINEEGVNVRYYPSAPTAEPNRLNVIKLQTPVVTMKNNTGTEDINSTQFINSVLHSTLDWTGKGYDTKYDVTYKYRVYKDGENAGDFKTDTSGKYDIILDAGNYTLEVKREGKDSNTIASGIRSYNFTVLEAPDTDKVLNGWHIEYDAESRSNCLVSSTYGDFRAKEIELYFVPTNSGSPVKVNYQMNSTSFRYDLSKAGLTSGKYTVYGRYIGMNGVVFDGSAQNTATSKRSTSTTTTSFTVMTNVTDSRITSDGKIYFKDLVNGSKSQAYRVVVNQTSPEAMRVEMVLDTSSTPVTLNYNDSTKEYSADMYDIFDYYNKQTPTPYPKESLFKPEAQYNVSVSAIGVNDINTITIESIASTPINFTKLKDTKNIDLNNYVVSFDEVSNAVKYVVKVGSAEQEFIAADLTSSSGRISIDIKQNATLLAGVNKDGSTSIVIHAVGLGANANADGGLLDSVKTTDPRYSTLAPVIESVDTDSGVLSWKPNGYFAEDNTNENKYRDVNYTVEYTIDDNTQSITNITPTYSSENGWIFESNIASLVTSGKVVKFRVYENNPSKFTGNASEYVFVTKLNSVELSYDQANNKAKWSQVTNASDYTVKVYNYDPTLNKPSTEISTITEIDITSNVYSVAIVPPKDNEGKDMIGTFCLGVVAGNSAVNDGSTEAKAYVMSSDLSVIRYNVGTNNLAITNATIKEKSDNFAICWNNLTSPSISSFTVKLLNSNKEELKSLTFANDGTENYVLPDEEGLLEVGTYYISIVPNTDTLSNVYSYVMDNESPVCNINIYSGSSYEKEFSVENNELFVSNAQFAVIEGKAYITFEAHDDAIGYTVNINGVHGSNNSVEAEEYNGYIRAEIPSDLASSSYTAVIVPTIVKDRTFGLESAKIYNYVGGKNANAVFTVEPKDVNISGLAFTGTNTGNSVINARIQWDKLASATDYTLELFKTDENGQNPDKLFDLNNYTIDGNKVTQVIPGNLGVGYYKITIKPNISSSNRSYDQNNKTIYIDTGAVSEIAFNITNTDVRATIEFSIEKSSDITSKARIVWNHVDGAKDYTVTLSKPTPVATVEEPSEGGEAEDDVITEQPFEPVVLTAVLDTDGTYYADIPEGLSFGGYIVQITAMTIERNRTCNLGTNTITHYVGAASNEVSFEVTPMNVAVDKSTIAYAIMSGKDYTVTWNALNSVNYINKSVNTGYAVTMVSVGDNSQSKTMNVANLGGTWYTIINTFEPQDYNVTILPVLTAWSRTTDVENRVISVPTPVATLAPIKIIDANLNATFNDTNKTIEWEQVSPTATYTAYYSQDKNADVKVDGVPVTATTSTSVSMGTTLSFDPNHESHRFNTGDTYFYVVAYVDYETEGVILISNELTADTKLTVHRNYQASNKLNIVNNEGTLESSLVLSEEGKLVFWTTDTLDATSQNIEIYVDGIKISSDLYTVEKAENPDVIYVDSTGSTFVEAGTEGAIELSYNKYVVDLSSVDGVIVDGKIKLNVTIITKTTNCLDSFMSSTFNVTKVTAIAVNDFYREGGFLTWSHHDNVTSYVISYALSGAAEATQISIVVDAGGNCTIDGLPVDGLEVKDGRVYMPFNQENFFGVGNDGDMIFTIMSYTNINGYINNRSSAQVVLTKLGTPMEGANTNVSIVDGKISVGEYKGVSTTKLPTKVYIVVIRYDDELSKPTENLFVDFEDDSVIYHIYNPGEVTEVPPAEDGGEPTYTTTEGYMTGFTIDLNNITYTVTDGENTILQSTSLDTPGMYRIAMQFVNEDDTNVVSSDTLVVYGFEKLPASKVQVTSGVTTWEAVESSSGYKVSVNDTVVADNSRELTFTDNTKTNLIDGTDYNFVGGSVYGVKVQALGGTTHLNSVVSNEYAIQKLQTPENLDVNTLVKNLNITELIVTDNGDETFGYATNPVTGGAFKGQNVLSWNNPNAISGLQLKYEIITSGAGGTTTTPTPSGMFVEQNTDGLYQTMYYTMPSDYAKGDYAFAVRMSGTNTLYENSAELGYLMSDITEAVNVKYVADVSNVHVDNGVVSWSAPESVKPYTYAVYIYDKDDYYDVEGNVNIGAIPVFKASTTETSIDLSKENVFNLSNYSGLFVLVIEAKTMADEAIVSSVEEKTNVRTLYKPNMVGDYKVKNGMLSWTYNLADLDTFVTAYKTELTDIVAEYLKEDEQEGEEPDAGTEEEVVEIPTYLMKEAIIRYITQRITSDVPEIIDEFDEILSFMINFNVEVNTNSVVSVNPTNVKALDASGNTLNGTYFTATKLEFEFNVNFGEGSGINSYGNYNLRVSSQGNSNDLVSVVNSAYTSKTISAYKPMAPKTWLDSGEDIFNGNILWQLVTDEKSNAQGNSFITDYRVYARINDVTSILSDAYQNVGLVDVGGTKYLALKNADGSIKQEGSNPVYVKDFNDNNVTILDGSKIYAHALELFNDGSEITSNMIWHNTDYNIYIRTNGTIDSSVPGFTGTIYLNSEEVKLNNTLNVLSKHETDVTAGKLNFRPGVGTQFTRLYIFGPFNEDGADMGWNENGWFHKINEIVTFNVAYDKLVEVYQKEVIGLRDNLFITNRDQTKYIQDLWNNEFDYECQASDNSNYGIEVLRHEFMEKLQIVDKPFDGVPVVPDNPEEGEEGSQTPPVVTKVMSSYSLTDVLKKNGEQAYPDGTYIMFTQDMGDTYGVLDGDFSDTEKAIKLDESYRNGTSWIGRGVNAGRFIWGAVSGANAYKIKILVRDPDQMETVYPSIYYTTKTYFDLPSDKELNKEGYTYALSISPTCLKQSIIDEADDERNIRTDDTGIVDNCFVGDSIQTDYYQRLSIPYNIHVLDGILRWNFDDYGDELVFEEGLTPGGYTIRFNDSSVIVPEEDVTDDNILITENETEINLTSPGQISMNVRAIVSSGYDIINSSYTNSVMVIKRENPDARVINGVFTWSTEGNATSGGKSETPSELLIDSKLVLPQYDTDGVTILTPDVTSYNYFTELTANNFKTYNLTTDNALFPVGAHHFAVKFMGTKGSSVGIDKYYLESEIKEFDATKLSAPILEKVAITAQDSSNKIRWQNIPNATAYKVVVAINGELQAESYLSTDVNASDYFTTSGDYTYFILDKIVDNNSTGEGMSMNVFVQAMGTDSSKTLEENAIVYINSSYSDRIDIAVPPAPSGVIYNPETGTISWVYPDAYDNNVTFNVVMNISYLVANVTEDELNDYWLKSATSKATLNADDTNYGAVTNITREITPYSEIKTRMIAYRLDGETGKYKILVRDTIVLLASDNKDESGNPVSPTSYTVTSWGTKYSFELIATTGAGIDDYGAYQSDAVIYIPQDGNNSFELFSSGDGSTYLPYKIANYTEFLEFGNFPSRHFKVTQDIKIPATDVWKMIDNEFTGSIDGGIYNADGSYTGNNYMIYPINLQGEMINAFMNTNSGTIKNLDLVVNGTVIPETTYSSYEAYMAGLVIRNNGTISNVNIVTDSRESTHEDYRGASSIYLGSVFTTGTGYVAGLVIDNYGTIENSSVNATITALTSGTDYDYILTSRAGGIAYNNYGLIKNTTIDGTIMANYVGGIVVYNNAKEIDNVLTSGIVQDCTSIATLIGTDRGYNDNEKYAGVKVGGLVCELRSGSKLIDSNSNCTIQILLKYSTNNPPSATIASMIGSIVSGSYNSTTTVTGNKAHINYYAHAENEVENNPNRVKVFHVIGGNFVDGIVIEDNEYAIIENTTNTNYSSNNFKTGINESDYELFE